MGLSDVEVLPFTGLLVDFCRRMQGRPGRSASARHDRLEYELQQADLNATWRPTESVFVMSNSKYGVTRALSIVREISSMGSDVSSLVLPPVNQRLREHYCA